MRADAWRLGKHGHVDIADRGRRAPDPSRRILEEKPRGRALPLGVGRREVLADVAVADGAQQSVGQCMQHDIGIGVPFKAVL